MTEEMYRRLNDYLNDIFIELDKYDKIFVDTLHTFIAINNMVKDKFKNQTIENISLKNNLTFEDVFLLTREIIEQIDKSYINDYDQIIRNGELDFGYDMEYEDSKCNVSIKDGILKKKIDINRDFNYSDVLKLVHEFIHYKNLSNNRSYNQEFLEEFISIYFELWAIKYLRDIKNVSIEELSINSRIISMLRNNDSLYGYIVILLAYENLGNINKHTIDDLNNILFQQDDGFEQECIRFLSKLDKLNEKYFNDELTKKLLNSVNLDYKYVIGTILAYYAIENCKLKDMVELNNNIFSEEYSNLSIYQILKKVGICINEKTVAEALKIIENSIYIYGSEKQK